MVFSESVVEEAAFGWFRELGYQLVGGPDSLLAPCPLRDGYSDVVLLGTLQSTLTRLNPDLPSEALGDGLRRLIRPAGATLRARNRSSHRMLVNGVNVEYQEGDGIRGAQVQVIDFDDPSNNDWLAVNQFTVVEDKNRRRPDIVVFVNGLPLGVIELKNPADEEATVWEAWHQLQTYKAELPSLFSMNEILVVSDGLQTLAGTLTAGREWFKPWRTIEGEELAPATLPTLEVLIRGVFDKKRFLDLVRDFVVFEDDGGGGWSRKWLATTSSTQFGRRWTRPCGRPGWMDLSGTEDRRTTGINGADRRQGGAPGDRRIGVVWHTQGSGKSLTMAFYAGAIIREPAMRTRPSWS